MWQNSNLTCVNCFLRKKSKKKLRKKTRVDIWRIINASEMS